MIIDFIKMNREKHETRYVYNSYAFVVVYFSDPSVCTRFEMCTAEKNRKTTGLSYLIYDRTTCRIALISVNCPE